MELDLDGIREAHISIVCGAVAATATAGDGPGFVSVRHHPDNPVLVAFEDGVLEVRQEEAIFGFVDGRRREVVVELTAPAATLLRVNVVSAPAVVRGFDDRVDVHSVSGPVTLDALGGAVRTKTVSGDVEARALRDTLSANTVSGDVTLVEGRCHELAVKTVSGDVVLDLHPSADGSYAATTLSGAVALRVDDDAPVDFDVSTGTGRIDSAFDLRRRTGGATVKVRTMSGKVSLLRPARA